MGFKQLVIAVLNCGKLSFKVIPFALARAVYKRFYKHVNRLRVGNFHVVFFRTDAAAQNGQFSRYAVVGAVILVARGKAHKLFVVLYGYALGHIAGAFVRTRVYAVRKT